MMFKLNDIKARLDLLASTGYVTLLNGDLNYIYNFDNVVFNTYNYNGIELITFFVCGDKYIEVTYKYLNAIMTKVINLVRHEDTNEMVFYLDSFSMLNELFSTLPKCVDYIDVCTLYDGSEFVEKYIELVYKDKFIYDRYVQSGRHFVRGYRYFVRFYSIDFDGLDAQGDNQFFIESLLQTDLFKGEEPNISNMSEVIKYASY